MKNTLTALVVAATSLVAFGASYVAPAGQLPGSTPRATSQQDVQIMPNDCACSTDATYTPNQSGGPNCNGTFGITWTRLHEGICGDPGCPASRPCRGTFTVDATGECASLVATVEEDDGFPTVIGAPDYPYTDDYTLDCGSMILVMWGGGALHRLDCEGC